MSFHTYETQMSSQGQKPNSNKRFKSPCLIKRAVRLELRGTFKFNEIVLKIQEMSAFQ